MTSNKPSWRREPNDFAPLILDDEGLFADLMKAIDDGDAGKLKMLIQSGAPVNAKTEDGATPLFRAVQSKNIECVSVLLDVGAAINQRVTGIPGARKDGSALNTAVAEGAFDYAHLLLDNGADPNMVDHGGNSALHFLLGSVSNGIISVDQGNRLLERLLRTGAAINQSTYNGETALHLAVRSGAPVSTVEILLRHNADLRALTLVGWQPIHNSWSDANLHLLPVLLSAGADINARCEAGNTPIFFARSASAVRRLVELGADVQAVNRKGQQALAYRVYTHGSSGLETVVALLEVGIDPCHADFEGNTVYTVIEHDSTGRSDAVAGIIASWLARRAIREGIARSPRAAG